MRSISIETADAELILQAHPLIQKALVEVLVPRQGVVMQYLGQAREIRQILL